MKQHVRLAWSLLPLSVAFAAQVSAQDDVISFGGSVQEFWDSNYKRTQEEDAERYTVESAFFSLNKELSRQRFIARWNGRHYDYDQRSDLDATINEGQLQWKGNWGSRLATDLQWVRDAYQVDQLEFAGKDIVSREDARAEIGYGAGHRMVISLGARQAKQRHSNSDRRELEFDEDEGFIEAQYQTGLRSTLALRYLYGERTYPNGGLELAPNELDFDYYQTELEGNWIATPKTNIGLTLAYFNRDGIVNDGSGALASLTANWEMSPKVQLAGGFEYRQPAVGETSDSPADIQTIFITSDWQWTSKISIGAGLRYSRQNYENLSPGPERDESLYSVTPLSLIYQFSESFSIRMDTSWVDRESPLVYRDYSAAQGNVGLFLRY